MVGGRSHLAVQASPHLDHLQSCGGPGGRPRCGLVHPQGVLLHCEIPEWSCNPHHHQTYHPDHLCWNHRGPRALSCSHIPWSGSCQAGCAVGGLGGGKVGTGLPHHLGSPPWGCWGGLGGAGEQLTEGGTEWQAEVHTGPLLVVAQGVELPEDSQHQPLGQLLIRSRGQSSSLS